MSDTNNDFAQFEFEHDDEIATGLGKDNDTFTAKMNGDFASMTEGRDGATINVLTNKSGVITLKVLDSSPFNSYLNKVMNSIAAGGKIAGQITARDIAKNKDYFAEKSIIQKMPDAEQGPESGLTTWSFLCPVLEITHGE